MKTFLLLGFLLFGTSIKAKRLCDTYSWMSCPDAFAASRSTTSSSLPLNSASAPTNPSSMSVDKGFGLEILRFGNYYDISMISGTGVIGSAFSVSNNENTFFGERAPETISDYVERELNSQKYKSPKISSLFAVQLLGGKRKNSFKLNLGFLGRYNKDTKGITGGAGLSMAYRFFSMGAAQFKNDFKDSQTQLIDEYTTKTFTFGFKIGSVAVDWNYIKNDAILWSRVRILTATLFTKKFMFTFGNRQEESIFPTAIPPLSGAPPRRQDKYISGSPIFL
ncbi:MAG: hypothetical protein NXH75_11850 [Halobacteriovoraceae bacterium]|nr:hypothetical protein [Halobacteriovoraceae bacterium]